MIRFEDTGFDISRPFELEAESIRKTLEELDREQFTGACEALASAERIGTSGCGHSGIACRHMAHLMCCIERPARFISPAEAVHGATGFLQKDDVLILVSRGGKTDELIPIANIAKSKGCRIITLTENLSSPLAGLSDYVLKMVIIAECDRYNCQGTTSFAVTNALFDAMQSLVIELTGFKNEQFAVIHPAGAVGKRLNNK